MPGSSFRAAVTRIKNTRRFRRFGRHAHGQPCSAESLFPPRARLGIRSGPRPLDTRPDNILHEAREVPSRARTSRSPPPPPAKLNFEKNRKFNEGSRILIDWIDAPSKQIEQWGWRRQRSARQLQLESVCLIGRRQVPEHLSTWATRIAFEAALTILNECGLAVAVAALALALALELVLVLVLVLALALALAPLAASAGE